MKGFIEDYIYKRLDFKFFGKSLHLFTSQELFSSREIDQGSNLLLQSIGKQIPLDDKLRVLDVGCGIGTLGLILKTQNPDRQLDFTDRDALAILFTEYNSAANKLAGSNYFASLGINQIPEKKYDLVVSNIPAKAGNPVIEEMINGFCSIVTKNGLVAIVIVKTLAEFAERIIVNNHGNVIYKNVSKEYTVFHYNGLQARQIDKSLKPYIRGSFDFKINKLQYKIQATYGIPEFDHLSYSSELAIDMLNEVMVKGNVLVQNPGQGHIPIFLLLCRKNEINQLSISSRDLLSLSISELNILENTKRKANKLHIPYLRQLNEKFDFIFINYQKESIPSAEKLLMADSKRLLNKNGELVLVSKSTFLVRFAGLDHHFKKLNDVKYKGYRCIHYQSL